MLVSGQTEPVQFFPSFIRRMQAAVAYVQHSAGTDKQALQTRWSVYVFPTSLLIFRYVCPLALCVCLWCTKHCFSMISYLRGIDDNSVGPPDPLVLITIIIHPLTTARLLHNRPLVAASPVVSLTHCVKGSLFYGGGRLVDIN